MNAYSLFKVPHQRVAPADDFILEEIAPLFYGAVRRIYPASFAGLEYLLQGCQLRNDSIDPLHCVR